jgi:hypothetical protein
MPERFDFISQYMSENRISTIAKVAQVVELGCNQNKEKGISNG